MASVDLQHLFTQISETLSLEDKEATVESCKSVFGRKYEGDLIGVLNKLEKDNRISISNTYIIEECLATSSAVTKSQVSKLIQQFQKSFKKQIENLKQQENILIKRKALHDMAETVIRNGHGLLLHGDHGTGKTWLAKDFINERYGGKAKEVDLRDIKDIRVASVEILRQFGYPVSVKDINLKIFSSHLRKVKQSTMLFLDNADAFFDGEESEQTDNYNFSDIMENIVDAGRGKIKILITSRNQSQSEKVNRLIKQERIGHLEGHLAMKLLRNFKMHSMPTEEQLVTAVELCKSLPLNLTILGGVLQDHGSSLNDVLQFVQKDVDTATALLSKLELNKEKETSIHTESFFNLSFNKLSDTLQQYAVCMSLFCRAFSISSLSSVLDNENIQKLKMCLNALKHVKIIHEVKETAKLSDIWFDMHPKIRQYLKSRKTDEHIASFYEEAKSKFLRKYKLYFQQLATLLEKNYQEAQFLLQEDYSNFEFVFAEHINTGMPLFENYHDLQMASVLLQSMFQRQWRIDFFQRLAKSSSMSGNLRLSALFLCHAAHCKAELNPDEAKKDLEKAKESLDKLETKDKETDAVYSMYYAATGNADFRICEKSGKLEDIDNAIEAYSKSCSLREKIYKDVSNTDMSSAYSGLGATHNMKSELVDGENKIKQLDFALNYFTKAMKTLMKISKSGMHNQMPVVLQNIGTVFQLKEKYKKAEDYFKQALKTEKKLHIDGFYNTATIMCNLANVYRELEKHDKALEMARQAVAIRTELFGDHFKTVQTLYIEAVVLHEQQRFIDAIDAYKRAFEMNEKLDSSTRKNMRDDIYNYMVVAYDEAISRKHTYLEEELHQLELRYEGIEESDVSSLHEEVEAFSSKLQDSEINAGFSQYNILDAGTAKMLMNENGGMFLFEYLGVSLNVPKAALSSSLEIELSRKSLPNNSVDLAFGESRLSDVIIFGPENTTLLKPCTLNIPYHLHEKPSMTEIVAKHFVSSEEKWIILPASLITESIEDPEMERKLAQIKIMEPGLYVICLVLKSVEFDVAVDKEPIELSPFGEDVGIKLRFKPGTFGKNPGKCVAKVNIFTDDAKAALRNLGVTISPILHIDTPSGVPKKSVEIQLPFDQTETTDGMMVVLQGNDNGDFEDITGDSKYKLQENGICFQVDHFSLFLWASVQGNISKLYEYIKTYVYAAFHTVFHLYADSKKIFIKDAEFLSCCIACSTHDDMESEKMKYLDPSFDLIAKSKSQNGIYNGTQLSIQVLGTMKCDSLDPLEISFTPWESCFTETFRLLEVDDEKQAENAKDYFVIKGHHDGVKYGSIPYWKLLEEINDVKHEDDDPPFRFLGLALQNCKLEDARPTNFSNFSKFELHLGLPDSVIQDLKAMRNSKGDISIMKTALEKISEFFIKGALKDLWFENCFLQLEPKHMAEKLSKVWDFLNSPISDLERTSVHNLLQSMCSVDKIDTVGKTLGLHFGYKHGDIENITRQTRNPKIQGENPRDCRCLLIIRQAFNDQKVSTFIELVKYLLKARIGRKNSRIFQEILDELGFAIEQHLNLIEPD